MDVKHPKRKKDKQNPYTLSIENGKEYISFHDTEGTYRKIEVTHVLFSQFNDGCPAMLPDILPAPLPDRPPDCPYG